MAPTSSVPNMMNPAQVAANANRTTQLRRNVRQQTRMIDDRLNAQGIVSPVRKANARAKGYRGPLTRAELAKRVS